MISSLHSSVVSRQLSVEARRIFLLIVLLSTSAAAAYAQEQKIQQVENPFVPVLKDIAAAAEGKGAELLLDGKKIFGSKKKTVEEGKGPFQIKQYKMGPVDGVAAVETVVHADHGDSPYVLSMFSVQTAGLVKDIQLSYPIDPAFMPATWEFNAGSENYQCDLILYDSRLEPEIYAKAYGINTIPVNKVWLKTGRSVMLVRILYSDLNTRGFKTHPVIRSDGKGKRLVIPMPGADPKIRVLFCPLKYQQENVTAIRSSDFSKTTLRFGNFDDIYQFMPGFENFMLASEPKKGEPVKIGFGTEYAEPVEPNGKLIALFDFENITDGKSADVSGDYKATVEDGRLVDGGILGGKCLYLGKRREGSRAKIIVPKSVREKFDKDQFTMSAWFKIPWGQLGQHDLVFWPYRRGAEGLEKPFAGGWYFGGMGELGITVSRWDGGDDFNAIGFRHKFNNQGCFKITPPGWKHVAVTGSRDQVKFFLNGKAVWEGTTPTPLTLDSFRKGGDLIFMTNFWGMADKLRIHDFALSEKQIAEMVDKDLPSTLLHYPLDSVADGFTPCVPPGDFPVDAWDWNARDFKKEITFAAEVGAAKVVEGKNGKGLQLDGQGVIIPPKAMMDLGINRISVAFWFKPESDKGVLLSSRGHPKHGFNIKYDNIKIEGVLCGNYEQLPVKQKTPTGSWHHFIFCFDNREVRMYLDGKQIKKQQYIPNLPMNLNDGLAIGVGVKGVFDDIRIFSRMIDENEAGKMYGAVRGGN